MELHGIELKDCPFCGSEPTPELNKRYSDCYQINCDNCGGANMTSEYGWEAVAEKWNDRACDGPPKAKPAGEYRVTAKPYFVHRRCDCGKGEMVATGEAKLSSPPRYPHICDACGKEEMYSGKKYPRLEYLED